MKFLLGLSMFILASCSQSDEASISYLNKIETAFSSGAEELTLSETTNFKWDEACFFKYDDTPKYLTYNQYLNYIKNENILNENSKLKKAPYTNIILFLDKGMPVEAYGLIAPKIEISGNKYFLSVSNLFPSGDENKICAKSTGLNLKPAITSRGYGQIIISNE